MTTMQIEYNKLLETQRANRAKEALTAADLARAERETAIKERKASYEIAEYVSSTKLKDAQMQQALASVSKTLADAEVSKATVEKVGAEVNKLLTDTTLSAANIARVYQETSNLVSQKDLTEANISQVYSTIAKALKETDYIANQSAKVVAETMKVQADTEKVKAETSEVRTREQKEIIEANVSKEKGKTEVMNRINATADRVLSGIKGMLGADGVRFVEGLIGTAFSAYTKAVAK